MVERMTNIKTYKDVLKKLNYNIEFLPEKDFIDRINNILKSEEAKNLLNIYH